MTFEAHERPSPYTVNRLDVSNYISKSAKENKTSYTCLEEDLMSIDIGRPQISKKIYFNIHKLDACVLRCIKFG